MRWSVCLLVAGLVATGGGCHHDPGFVEGCGGRSSCTREICYVTPDGSSALAAEPELWFLQWVTNAQSPGFSRMAPWAQCSQDDAYIGVARAGTYNPAAVDASSGCLTV